MGMCALNQYNDVKNVDENILDLVLYNGPQNTIRVTRSGTPILKEDNYHPAIQIFTDIEIVHIKEKPHRFFNFRKANYDRINHSLSLIDWSNIEPMSTDNAVDYFYNVINNLIVMNTPRVQNRKYPN